MRIPSISRRQLLSGTARAALLMTAAYGGGLAAAPGSRKDNRVAPIPLRDVRLLPSPFLTSIESNRVYLHSLDPDRLLHNFRLYAGLEPKADIYGGWENDTIAGHTLGHYLTACALMHAQTGDALCRERALYTVGELQVCQDAGGDGYVAGFTRSTEDGDSESGRRVFEEIAAGDIRPAKFYINGSWAPLYNWHKLFAGLHHADVYLGSRKAVAVQEGLAGYLHAIFAQLSDAQLQRVLDCEHGGINESLADLYTRTDNPRWLALAERVYHREVLDPLANRQDELSHLHANTQIPKLIGLARLHQITDKPQYSVASRYFWETVTEHRSYVIGGNADREYFQEPDSISKYITDETCESCNTYNMMKLTRELYRERPQASYFDYYERAHFNHILAQHQPHDGMFAYMVPLMSGSHRAFSEPYDSFWCCVGSGMESHAKHGDSVYWSSPDTLYVNLFVPSEIAWNDMNAAFRLETEYPYQSGIALTTTRADGPSRFAVAFRIPGWADGYSISINGQREQITVDDAGYAVIERDWAAGDRIELDIPLGLRVEATPDDPDTVAVLYGPLVLAADLGPVGSEYALQDPAFVETRFLEGFSPTGPARFRTEGVSKPFDLAFAPFFELRDRLTAVYFRKYSPAEWSQAEEAATAAAAAQAALDARSVDLIRLGVPDNEEAHKLAHSERSYAVEYRKRPGRDARTGNFFEFDMAVNDEPLVLEATYWGGERERRFHILVDGERLAHQTLEAEKVGEFIDVRYEVPRSLTRGKRTVRVRFVPDEGHTAGPVFGVRLFRA